MKSMVSYWRRSLLDGANTPGALRIREVTADYWQVSHSDIENAALTGAPLERWVQKVLHKSKTKPKQVENAAIIPLAYQKKAVHGQVTTSGEPEILIPLYLPCMIDDKGCITPQAKLLPIIPRDILLPLEDMEYLAIGTMEDFSKAVDAAQLSPDFSPDGNMDLSQ